MSAVFQSTQVAPITSFRNGLLLDVSFANGERYSVVVNHGETLGRGPVQIKQNYSRDVERKVRRVLYRLGNILRTHEGRDMDKIAARAAQVAATTASMAEFLAALEKLVAKVEDFAMMVDI